MKVKEKEKKGQTKEQNKVAEPPNKNITASSMVAAKTEHGCTITIEHVADINKGDKLRSEQKADDKLRGMQVVQAIETENESESVHQETNKEDQLVVEFEDQTYELT